MFEIGERVTWTHANVSRNGKTLTMQLREGVVEELHGEAAIVKRGKRRLRLAVGRLRKPGEQSQISEFVDALVGRGREELPRTLDVEGTQCTQRK